MQPALCVVLSDKKSCKMAKSSRFLMAYFASGVSTIVKSEFSLRNMTNLLSTVLSLS